MPRQSPRSRKAPEDLQSLKVTFAVSEKQLAQLQEAWQLLAPEVKFSVWVREAMFSLADVTISKEAQKELD